MTLDVLLGFRFGVFFFAGGLVPNPLDIRFQKVSGLSAEVKLDPPFGEGGQNVYSHRLPSRVEYGNLTLERGMVIGSPLNIEFNMTMSLFEFNPSNVMVTLFSEESAPLAACFCAEIQRSRSPRWKRHAPATLKPGSSPRCARRYTVFSFTFR